MGQLMKCDAIYTTPFWRAAGLNGFGINDSGAARAVFDNTPPDGGPGVLLAFVGGSTWRTYGVLPKAQRRQAVLEGFAAMFGDAGAAPGRLRRARLDQGALDRRRPDRDPRARARSSSSARPSARRTAGCTGPAPRPRRTGPATWTARSAPASAPPSRSWSGCETRSLAARPRRWRWSASRRLRPRRPRPAKWETTRLRARSRRPASRRTSSCTATAGSTPARTSTRTAPARRRGSSSGAGAARCCARGRCPARRLGADHGVQVANQTRAGRLVRARDLDLDGAHPRHPHRALAHGRHAARAPSPTTRPGDRAARCSSPTTPQGVIWKVGRDGRAKVVVHLAGARGRRRLRHHRHRVPQAGSATC